MVPLLVHFMVNRGNRDRAIVNWLNCWLVDGLIDWFIDWLLGHCFKHFIFSPTWGRLPIWLILFKWVETTNYINSSLMDWWWLMDWSVFQWPRKPNFRWTNNISLRKSRLCWIIQNLSTILFPHFPSKNQRPPCDDTVTDCCFTVLRKNPLEGDATTP